jgi:hypothetical protein
VFSELRAALPPTVERLDCSGRPDSPVSGLVHLLRYVDLGVGDDTLAALVAQFPGATELDASACQRCSGTGVVAAAAQLRRAARGGALAGSLAGSRSFGRVPWGGRCCVR